VYFRLIYIQR